MKRTPDHRSRSLLNDDELRVLAKAVTVSTGKDYQITGKGGRVIARGVTDKILQEIERRYQGYSEGSWGPIELSRQSLMAAMNRCYLVMSRGGVKADTINALEKLYDEAIIHYGVVGGVFPLLDDAGKSLIAEGFTARGGMLGNLERGLEVWQREADELRRRASLDPRVLHEPCLRGVFDSIVNVFAEVEIARR